MLTAWAPKKFIFKTNQRFTPENPNTVVVDQPSSLTKVIIIINFFLIIIIINSGRGEEDA